MEQSKEITCPTCDAIYIDGLNEQLNISSDYAHCEKLKGELIEKISDATNRLSRYEEEYNKLSNDLQEEEKLIQKSQELLSYSSYYENKGQHENYKSCKTRVK